MNKIKSSVAWRTYPRLASLGLGLLLTAITAVPSFAQDMKTVSASLASRIAASGRKTVAVIDFTDLQGNVTELGRFLAEELSVDLVADAKGFEVIERTQLKVILQEHKLATTGLIDPQTARKLGQIAGVDALVTGTITPFGDTVRLSAKVLDTTTARMIAASTVDIPKTRAIEDLLAKGIESPQPSSGPEPASAGQAAKAVSVEENDLLFVLRVCRRSGTVLSCAGSITNKAGERRRVSLSPNYSQVVDDQGNFYKVRRLAFGSVDSKQEQGATVGAGAAIGAIVGAIAGSQAQEQQELEPDLPINWFLSIDGVKPAASRINIVVAYSVGLGTATVFRPDAAMRLAFEKVTLRNVPIQQK
jgi:TolB-like protein